MNKKDLKIVFFGTPEFAAYSLEKIHRGGYNIAAVVTMPDKPAGRGHKMLQSAVKQYAVEAGLPLLQPVSLKAPEFVDALRALDADLFIVIAFRMLPQVVWEMPPLGTFNLHASLLPRYRGAAPINHAVMNGDKVTGVTTFFLKHEIDTGDIIDRESIEIGDDENVGSVHDRLMALGAELTVKTIDSIIDGTLTTTPQSMLEGEPTAAPKIFKETCEIRWTMDARSVHNHVRGLSPYPGAWSKLEPLGEVKIFETRVAEASTLVPGEARIDGERLFVGCGDSNEVEILSVQAPGKRRMATAELLRGLRK